MNRCLCQCIQVSHDYLLKFMQSCHLIRPKSYIPSSLIPRPHAMRPGYEAIHQDGGTATHAFSSGAIPTYWTQAKGSKNQHNSIIYSLMVSRCTACKQLTDTSLATQHGTMRCGYNIIACDRQDELVLCPDGNDKLTVQQLTLSLLYSKEHKFDIQLELRIWPYS